MAIILRWQVTSEILNDTSFDKVYIYRASSELGTYSEIANQLITDDTYLDTTGSTTNWYKVRFYDSTNTTWSDYSDTMQGGIFSGYCSINDIRAMTNISSSDISDGDLFDLISRAISQINPDVNTHVEREFITPIDNTRENKIDGSNTTFYIQNWFGKYIADSNNDGNVTVEDIIVYQVANDGTESQLSVSSIVDNEGKFVLTTAPSSGVRLYVTYDYSFVREKEGFIDARLRTACIFLTAAYGYAKVNIGRAPSVQFGSTKLTRHIKSFESYYSRYLTLIQQIQSLGGLVQYGENVWTF